MLVKPFHVNKNEEKYKNKMKIGKEDQEKRREEKRREKKKQMELIKDIKKRKTNVENEK